MHARTHTRTHARTHAHTHTHTHTHTCNKCMCLCMSVYMCACECFEACIHVCFFQTFHKMHECYLCMCAFVSSWQKQTLANPAIKGSKCWHCSMTLFWTLAHTSLLCYFFRFAMGFLEALLSMTKTFGAVFVRCQSSGTVEETNHIVTDTRCIVQCSVV